MRFSEELMPTEKVVKQLERQLERGLISRAEFEWAIGTPESVAAFFALPKTRRVSVEEAESEEGIWGIRPDVEWWQSFKNEIMQDGDELWIWDTIANLAGSMGILLVRGDTIVYVRALGKA